MKEKSNVRKENGIQKGKRMKGRTWGKMANLIWRKEKYWNKQNERKSIGGRKESKEQNERKHMGLKWKEILIWRALGRNEWKEKYGAEMKGK